MRLSSTLQWPSVLISAGRGITAIWHLAIIFPIASYKSHVARDVAIKKGPTFIIGRPWQCSVYESLGKYYR